MGIPSAGDLLRRSHHLCCGCCQYNFVHELGIWEKQSAFYFQAKSCQNLIMGNVCVVQQRSCGRADLGMHTACPPS